MPYRVQVTSLVLAIHNLFSHDFLQQHKRKLDSGLTVTSNHLEINKLSKFLKNVLKIHDQLLKIQFLIISNN